MELNPESPTALCGDAAASTGRKALEDALGKSAEDIQKGLGGRPTLGPRWGSFAASYGAPWGGAGQSTDESRREGSSRSQFRHARRHCGIPQQDRVAKRARPASSTVPNPVVIATLGDESVEPKFPRPVPN